MTAYRTDKIELGYLPVYKGLAARYAVCREGPRSWQPPYVLEVGTGDGGGMELFRDLFGPLVFGVDNAPHRAVNGVLLSQQDDPDLPARIVDAGMCDPADGRITIIIDDASHMPQETITTFRQLWPLIKPGGTYVIEDWNYLQGPDMFQISWQTLLGHWIGWSHQDAEARYSGITSDIDGVEFRHGMIIVRKRD